MSVSMSKLRAELCFEGFQNKGASHNLWYSVSLNFFYIKGKQEKSVRQLLSSKTKLIWCKIS